jgi:flagellar hook-basal body complex protein FliE
MDGLDRVRAVLDTLPGAEGLTRKNAAAGAGFGEAFKQALLHVSADQAAAEELQQRFQLNDQGVTLEATMLATQSASISFQALVQVRNRLLSAYHDIMTMQV